MFYVKLSARRSLPYNSFKIMKTQSNVDWLQVCDAELFFLFVFWSQKIQKSQSHEVEVESLLKDLLKGDKWIKLLYRLSYTIILSFHPVGNDYNVFQVCYMPQNQKKTTSNLTFQQARNYLLVVNSYLQVVNSGRHTTIFQEKAIKQISMCWGGSL